MPKPPGRTYEVGIKADPEHFLHYDKPLSEQSEHVKSALKKLGWDADSYTYPHGKLAPKMGGPTGEDVIREMQDRVARRGSTSSENSASAAKAMNEAGIPGIKYLDQGSRSVGSKAGVDDTIIRTLDAVGGSREKAIKELEGRIASAKELPEKYQSKNSNLSEAVERLKGDWKDPRSHNYVVFHHDLIDILKKYGIAGLGAIPAAGAYHYQDKPQMQKRGGPVKRATGGEVPWFVRQEARANSHYGLLKSQVPGRTDKLPVSVKGGSYVLPADIVSAMGQGNTQAGGTILGRMFNKGPYGMALPHVGSAGRRGTMKMPKASKISPFAEGGEVLSDEQPDPIMAGLRYAMAEKDNPLTPHLGPEMGPRMGPSTYTGASGNKVVAPNYGKPLEGEVYAPPSSAVPQAINRLKAYLPQTHNQTVLQRNIEIMERGGPMAEKIAEHMLRTFQKHPAEGRGLARSGVTLDILPNKPIEGFARGGQSPDVPIVAAGGEYIIHANDVKELGGGDMEKGHNILDAFVLHVRKKHIHQLKHLKPPVKS
jgi:hypothetical protein